MNIKVLGFGLMLGSCLSLSLASCSANQQQSTGSKLQEKAIEIDRTNVASSELKQAQVNSSSQLVSQKEPAEVEDKTQFTCGTSYNSQLNQKVPTTLAWNPSGKRALIQWVKQMDRNWTPEKRCQEVSQRIQEANTAGTMKFITNGRMNGQQVICSAIEYKGDCKNLLMTLRPSDESLTFMSEFKEVFNGRSEGIITHNSGKPQVYYRIDLNKLWKNAPKVQ